MTLNLTDLSQCLLACIRIFKEYEQWVQYHCACHQAHRVFLSLARYLIVLMCMRRCTVRDQEDARWFVGEPLGQLPLHWAFHRALLPQYWVIAYPCPRLVYESIQNLINLTVALEFLGQEAMLTGSDMRDTWLSLTTTAMTVFCNVLDASIQNVEPLMLLLVDEGSEAESSGPSALPAAEEWHGKLIEEYVRLSNGMEVCRQVTFPPGGNYHALWIGNWIS